MFFFSFFLVRNAYSHQFAIGYEVAFFLPFCQFAFLSYISGSCNGPLPSDPCTARQFGIWLCVLSFSTIFTFILFIAVSMSEVNKNGSKFVELNIIFHFGCFLKMKNEFTMAHTIHTRNGTRMRWHMAKWILISFYQRNWTIQYTHLNGQIYTYTVWLLSAHTCINIEMFLIIIHLENEQEIGWSKINGKTYQQHKLYIAYECEWYVHSTGVNFVILLRWTCKMNVKICMIVIF